MYSKQAWQTSLHIGAGKPAVWAMTQAYRVSLYLNYSSIRPLKVVWLHTTLAQAYLKVFCLLFYKKVGLQKKQQGEYNE